MEAGSVMDMNESTRWIIQVLERSDFMVSRIQGVSEMSFDLAARKDDLLLLIKLIRDRSSIKTAVAGEMKVLSKVLSASPMIIIPSSRNLREQDGVLYISGGIPVMTMNTLRDHLLEEIPPMVYYNSGGHFVALDGKRMRDTRESMGISLGSLSKSIGVSRRAIQMYESGMGVDLETALRIEEILRSNLVLPLDPFSRSDELEEIRDGMSVDEGDCRDVVDHLGSVSYTHLTLPTTPYE
jgi:putative transcriptional regulator